MISVPCTCGRRHEVADKHAGRTLKCRCGRTVSIPGSRRRWRYPLPVSPPVSRLLGLACWLWLGSVIAAVILLWGFGDRWWLGTLFLYGPRWPLLLPAPLLLIAVLLVRPRLAAAVLAGVLLMIGPIMGYRAGWRGWFAGGAPASVRIITFNMRGGENVEASFVAAALLEYAPDIVLIQECNLHLGTPGAVPSGWSARQDASLCALTRQSIDSVHAVDVLQTRSDGMTGLAFLYFLELDGGTFPIVNLHLETPRSGIERVRWGGEVAPLARNILLRGVGARRIAGWVAEQAPAAIVAGDFNLPPESVIYRESWSRCQDAFAARGKGFGYTRILPKWAARIDHVLSCGSDYEAVSATVGPDLGSDHLPLIVDLRRRRVKPD